jgi:hypothetical protein
MAESTPLISPWQFNYTQGNLITRIDYDANSNAIYQGWAQPGTGNSDLAWRIIQNTYDGSNRFTASGFPGDANGNPSCAFSFSWTSRATYTYS